MVKYRGLLLLYNMICDRFLFAVEFTLLNSPYNIMYTLPLCGGGGGGGAAVAVHARMFRLWKVMRGPTAAIAEPTSSPRCTTMPIIENVFKN